MSQSAKLADLTPDQHNANLGTERGTKLLESSISKFGTGRSILIDKHGNIIAGNKTAEMAGQLGMEDVVVVPSDGTKVIAVQRTDLDLNHDNMARELAYADNRVAELDLNWDVEKLQADLEYGIDLEGHSFWSEKELNNILEINVGSLEDGKVHDVEKMSVGQIFDHPDNYREHPEDQLDHIINSIKQNGLYKNIIVAEDGTILAGHGVMRAVRRMGLKEVPVIKLQIDKHSPQALKILTGDNEISRLAEIDDRNLSNILKSINELDSSGLLGTGYDEMMLANLVMVTRPQEEIKDIDEASEWVGMPEYEKDEDHFKMVVLFKTKEERDEFNEKFNLKAKNKQGTYTTWWPYRETGDRSALRYE